MSSKYPRTPHVPFSPGGTKDDRRIASVEPFLNVDIVVTEKMDGSNVCVERDACYARSHVSAPSHPSFDAFKALHARIRHGILPGYQVFGEWLYARHSIDYDRLPGFFLVFGVRDVQAGLWCAWNEVTDWAERLGVPTVPVLLRGHVASASAFQRLVDGLATAPSPYGSAREGVVVRLADRFPDQAFEASVAKWVRSQHVQTDDHWKTKAIVKNRVKKSDSP